MNLSDAPHLMPSRPDPELLTIDESEINERVDERAAEILADAYQDPVKAYDLLDYGHTQETLADLVLAIGEASEDTAAWTAQERLERFLHKAEKLLREYAVSMAEMDRPEIERRWCNEVFGD